MTPFDELFEERAALVEYGCKVDRTTAERMAKQQMGVSEPVDVEEVIGNLAQKFAFKFE